jgi:hypothetical protein
VGSGKKQALISSGTQFKVTAFVILLRRDGEQRPEIIKIIYAQIRRIPITKERPLFNLILIVLI